MTAVNFAAALDFVWAPERDSPRQGVHCTIGDPGGTTYGGVIQVTWDNAVVQGVVKGDLPSATTDQLSAVLRNRFWGPTCDQLPPGLDLLMFNGRVMTGRYIKLFQQALGLMGDDDVDGWIGPQSLSLARSREPETFIDALSGAHAAYLATLDTWPRFGAGWTVRIKAAQAAALALADAAPVA